MPHPVIANMPHGVPSRFVAAHRKRLVRPFLNWFFSIASRHWMLPAPAGCGFAMDHLCDYLILIGLT
jgi:hypothetical protein